MNLSVASLRSAMLSINESNLSTTGYTSAKGLIGFTPIGQHYVPSFNIIAYVKTLGVEVDRRYGL